MAEPRYYVKTHDVGPPGLYRTIDSAEGAILTAEGWMEWPEALRFEFLGELDADEVDVDTARAVATARGLPDAVPVDV